MNIYTATLIRKNYGSMLQAYALQSCVKQYGALPYVIIKQSSKKHSRLYHFFGHSYGLIKYLLKPDVDYSFSKKLKLRIGDSKYDGKYKKLDYFAKEKLSIQFIVNEKDFISSIPENSIFLAGSDQVWSSSSKLSWYAFQWVDGKYDKYSYAASIGKSLLSEEDLEKYKSALSPFKSISLRERQALNIFEPIFTDKVRQDLDPTLLWDKNFWRKIESPRLIEGPYVFVYRLRPNDDVFDLARKVSKEKNCRIVYTGSYAYSAKDVKTIYDAGVEDFLSLIDHAEAVVTNSFHGTAFSVIYEKPFLSAKVATTGSRAESLLSLLGLKSQYISNMDEDFSLQIDYAKANTILSKERDKSLDYLKSICLR